MSSKPPQSRRQARKDRTRDEILAAAIRVFARSGLDGARVDEIAAEADYSTGALYNYFANKEAILEALVKSVFAQMLEMVGQPHDVPDLPGQLRQTLERTFRFTEENRETFLLFMQLRGTTLVEQRTDLHDLVMGYFSQMIADSTTFYADWVGRGVIKPIEPGLLAHVFLGLVNQAIMHWFVSGTPGSLQERVPVIVDLMLHGAMRPEVTR